jgi:hypothetical protein
MYFMHIFFAITFLLAQSLFGGLPIDNISCQSMEGAVEHIHSHLQLFDRGKPVTVPAEVGISQAGNCLYWVHTHSPDGVIHIESPVSRTFTLGQFFDIWGMNLSRTAAASLNASGSKPLTVFVNGRRWTRDPRTIPLRNHEEIVIENGSPLVRAIPFDWSKVP